MTLDGFRIGKNNTFIIPILKIDKDVDKTVKNLVNVEKERNAK
jgi:hypothetical protein